MSATVIDALIVTLGLDPKAFNKGSADARKSLDQTRKEADRTAKEMEQRGKQAALFYTRIRNEALAMFATLAIGGGIKNFVANNIAGAASLGRLSDNLQTSTERLGAWRQIAERAGGSADGVVAQLKQSADEVARFKMGMSSDSMQWYFRMGGSTDALKDGNSYLLARADIVKKLFDVDPGRAAAVAQSMGISDDQFNLIKQGSAAILGQLAAREKLSKFSRQDADEADTLRKKWLDLRDNLDYSTTKVLVRLYPLLEGMLNRLQSLSDWAVAHRDDIRAWVELAVEKVTEFVKMMDKGAESVGGWKNVLVALLALKVLSFTANLLGMAGALGRVGVALGTIGTVGAGALKILGPLGLLLHSGSLNEGEDAELAKYRNYSGPTSGGNSLSTRQQYLVAKLRAEGFSDAQAAGIVGSLMQESGINPTAVNASSGASGIAQWLGPRKREFEKQYGMSPDKAPFEQQVNFMLWELRNTEKRSGDLLKRAGTAEQAAQIHAWEYERPGVAEANIAKRQQYAASVFAGVGAANAASAAALPVGARASAPGVPNAAASAGTTITSETHIEKIEIKTNATDAAGIAKDIGPALKQHGLISQANTGLN